MLDGLWSGILGGLFGPIVMRWAAKYRYWVTFFVVTIGVHLSALIQDAWTFGLHTALIRFGKVTFTFIGLGVPAAIGLLAVSCVFFFSVISRHANNKE